MAGNMQKMMKQMQQMQAKMAKLQEELAQTPVEATAGGGVVKVTVNGANQVLGIEINPEVLDPDDPESHQGLSGAGGIDQVEYGGEDHNEEHRLHPAEHRLKAHTGDEDGDDEAQRQQGIAQGIPCHKEGYDVEDCQQDLCAGIQPVEEGIAGEVLSQGNILEGHYIAPFLLNADRKASLACSTV